jgi:nucleoside-diphosphate-sugar epimerase
MSRVLVTGASGRIGSRLIERLARDHEVITLSRREVTGVAVSVSASFASREELGRLDPHDIDVAIHLAAELETCSEEAGLAVNVAGTRTLLRYLVDRGCRRFILASSITAIGCMAESFIPREVPIPDDHPCDAVDAYGFSKALMEDVAAYFHRLDPGLEIDLFRIGVVLSEDDTQVEEFELSRASRPFLIGGGMISMRDTVEAFARAVERPLGAGARRINVVGEDSVSLQPVASALEQALGERAAGLDLGFYRVEGNETRSLYAVDRVWETLDLRPSTGLRVGAVRAALEPHYQHLEEE